MSALENRAAVEAFYAAGDVGDLETALGLLADDVTWTNIGSTDFSGTYSGKESLVSNLLGPVFSRLNGGIESTVDNIIAEGDFVAVQLRGTAETVEGRPYNNTYCHVFRFEGGKIAEVTEYFDTALAQEVLGSSGADSAREPMDTSDGRAIRELFEGFIAAFVAKDLETLRASYTDDALVVPPGHPSIQGRDEIIDRLWSPMFEAFEVEAELPVEEIRFENEWGFVRGTYRLRLDPRAGGDPVTEEGRYIDVVRKTADGGWKIAHAIWNTAGS